MSIDRMLELYKPEWSNICKKGIDRSSQEPKITFVSLSQQVVELAKAKLKRETEGFSRPRQITVERVSRKQMKAVF